jgi:hypothetical protein
MTAIALAVQARGAAEMGDAAEAVALLEPWFEQVAPTMPPHEMPPRALTTLLGAAACVGNRALVERVGATLGRADDEMLYRRISGAGDADAERVFGDNAERAELILGHCMSVSSDRTVPLWLYGLLLNRKGVLSERTGSEWLRTPVDGPASAALLKRVRELRAQVARIDLEGGDAGPIQIARRRYADAVAAEPRRFTNVRDDHGSRTARSCCTRRAEALRMAQLAIREIYDHPANWAAFICQGAAESLSCRHIAPFLSCPTCERSIWRSKIASNVERIRLKHAWAPGYALPGFLLAASLDHAITGRGGRSGRRTEQTMPM